MRNEQEEVTHFKFRVLALSIFLIERFIESTMYIEHFNHKHRNNK